LKRCYIIVFACIMLSGGYYFYSTIHYCDVSDKSLISLENAFLSSPNIKVSCDNNQKAINTLGNQEQRNRIMDIVIKSEYMIISHGGVIDAAYPIKVCFPDNPDVSLILYGKNLIEISWKKHKVRLLSNDEELYSKVNMIVKEN